MHYYQHHIGDFIRDTANLNDHQLATYLRMLWSYYDTEKPLSGSCEDIAFAMRSDEKTVRLLLRHYFDESPDGWVHTRCEREITQYKSKKEKASKSANARWSNASAMRTHSERNASASKTDANQEPRTKNQEKKVSKATFLAAGAPEWVPAQEWADFVKNRKAMRNVPFTEAAAQGVINALKKLVDAGHDPAEMLRLAVMNGWRTVYPPKQPLGTITPINRQEAQEARNREVGERWLKENFG